MTATFTQYPIKLAWAVTIHKSQGQTFENVILNLDTGSFAHGQTYVALSRVVSLEGLYLTRRIKMSDEQTTTNDNPAVETQIADAVQGTVNTVLGSESDNLPAFITISPPRASKSGAVSNTAIAPVVTKT